MHSYADLRVRLLGWEGDGDDGNGDCCEPFCAGECDPYFQLCVTSNEYVCLHLSVITCNTEQLEIVFKSGS